MNRDAWHSSDPEWLKQRRQTWKSYELNLKKSNQFDASDLKYFEDYFLFGIEPKDQDGHYYDENVTLPLIIKAWLYPDCSEQNWLMIKNDVLKGSFQPETDVTASYRLLFEQGRRCEYSSENGCGDGFFLGDEKKLIEFFCGKPGIPEVVPIEGSNYLEYCSGTGMWLESLIQSISWFLADKKPNPYFIYQYLFENWKQVVFGCTGYFESLDIDSPPSFDPENFNPEITKVIMQFNGVKESLERLAKIRKESPEFEEPRKSFFIELCNFLDSEDLPKNLKKMWERVQQEA